MSAAGAALATDMTIDAIDSHDGYRLAKGHAGCDFKAQNAEREVREMVMEAEIQRLVEILHEHGYGDMLPDEPEQSDPSPPDDLVDDNIPPRQKGLWDE